MPVITADVTRKRKLLTAVTPLLESIHHMELIPLRNQFLSVQFLLRGGKRNWDSRFLILRNRHSCNPDNHAAVRKLNCLLYDLQWDYDGGLTLVLLTSIQESHHFAQISPAQAELG